MINDCVEFIKVLKNWQLQETKVITSVLQRMNDAKVIDLKALQVISKRLNIFHKEIIKAPENEVPPKWYQFSIKLKSKINQMIDRQKSAEKPELVKVQSEIVDYPQSLTSGRGQLEEKILKTMYKNFLYDFEHVANNPVLITFLQNGLRQLKRIYQDRVDDGEGLLKRVNSICHKLKRSSSKEAKEKMLNGQITPKQLAIDNEEMYLDEAHRQILRQNQLAQLQENSTGFYQQMKRKINKDACEQCRFCHQKKAFCEDMKQTRSADQPMTRFMRCNNCNQGWRD